MSSPTLRLRRLGGELRTLRTEADVSATALAKQIGTSQTKVSEAENARRKLSTGQLNKLIESLQVPDPKASELRTLRDEADQLGWWDEYSDILPPTIELLAGFEAAAAWIRRYEESFIPAMLQTPEYANAVVAAAAPYLSSGDVPRLVEFRMQRQQRLTDPGFRFTVVINEGALWRQVGGTQTMRAQLDHLLALDHFADVEVLVLPFEAGAHAAQGQTFAVITFPEDEDPDVVYSESLPTSGFLERYPEVRRHSSAFDSAARQALDLEDSRRRIEHAAQSMERRTR